MTTFSWACLAALVVLAGCGTITVSSPDVVVVQPDVPPADVGPDLLAPDVPPDVPADVTVTIDVAPDTVANQCQNDLDCNYLKGKTPCKLPHCDAGTCMLIFRAENEPCVDPGAVPAECQVSACTKEGQCTLRNKPNGVVCGVGVCGKKCDASAGAVSLCVAATPGDYDDANPCTNDYCDQGKAIVHEPLTDLTIQCDDGDLCTTGDTCTSGKCLGQTKLCTDGIDCTFDTCDKAAGCIYTPNPAKCDDGNACTKDGCDAVKGCVVLGPEVAKACDDGNACTTNDTCVEGACQGKPNCSCTTDAECAIADTPCTGLHKCGPNKMCIVDPATVAQCPPSTSPCLKNICDPKVGGCTTVPVADSTVCEDGDPCTAQSACMEGICKGAVNCDDANPCTADTCASPGGCIHTPTTAACDDGSACTTNDVCANGGCKGSQISCDDNVPCTFDACEEAGGTCTHAVNNALCADGNPCTSDVCDSVQGCTHSPDNTAACTDNNDCTADACQGGKCVSVVTCACQVDADCNDNNPCTKDSCTGNKCVATAADGGACSVADKCMLPNSGVCGGGKCGGGTPLDCSKFGDACNAATCNATTGACETVPKAPGTGCDADGNGCTQGDYCVGGKCNPGGAPPCAAPTTQPCLVGACKSIDANTYQCTTNSKPVGTKCDDGKPCTTGDACSSTGTCVAPTFLPVGTACDDGLFCTESETCDSAGICGNSKAKLCNGPKCSKPYCDEVAKTCFATPIAGCCVADTDCDDGMPCTKDACKFTTSPGQCSYNSAGTTCCDPTIWGDDFEVGLHGMILTNLESPALGWQWRFKSPQAKSGSGVLYYGNPVANNYVFDGAKNNGQAMTPSMLIPAGKATTLNAYVFMDTELPAQYDSLSIKVLPAGMKLADATEIWKKPSLVLPAVPPADGMPAKDWFPLTLPLDKFAGQSVQIIFDFDTIDNVNNQTTGAFIDDVSVTTTCP